MTSTKPAGDRVRRPLPRTGPTIAWPALPVKPEDARAARFARCAREHDPVRRRPPRPSRLSRPVRVIGDERPTSECSQAARAPPARGRSDHADGEQRPGPADDARVAATLRRRQAPRGSACPDSDAADGNAPAAGPAAVSGPLPRWRRGGATRSRGGPLGRLHAVLAERGEVDQQVDGVGRAARSVMSLNRTWVRQFRDGVGRASHSARHFAPRA